MDYRGLALIVGGVGLSVFGFQQSALWGWGNPAIEASIVAGVVLLVVFFFVERRTESPLINVRIFENRTFLVENVILGIAMMAFIPVFFFAAIYGQIALAEKATTSSLLILYFFIGFVICAQIGGRMLDRIGAKRPVVLGCALAAVGFGLWAGKVTDLHAGAQVIYIVIAGAGMGLMLGQANTDAINRASRYSYGEATGITQTVRNYGASLGFAILGTILITEFRSRITSSLTAKGLPGPAASAEAAKIAQLQGGSGNIASIPQFIRADFAAATREVLYGMCVIMAVAGFVALRGLKRGVQRGRRRAQASSPARTRTPTCTRLRTRRPRLGFGVFGRHGLGCGGQDLLEVGRRSSGGADVAARRLRHVPAVLEHLMKDLGRGQPAAQPLGDRGDHRIVDLLQPPVGRHHFGHRPSLFLLQPGAEPGDVVAQAPRLALAGVDPGAQEQLPRVVPGLRDPGLQPQLVAVSGADQLDLLRVEAELVEPSQPVGDPVPLVFGLEDLLPGQLLPQRLVPAPELLGDFQRLHAGREQLTRLQVEQLAVDPLDGQLEVPLPLPVGQLRVLLAGLRVDQVRLQRARVVPEQRVGQRAVTPEEARQVQPDQQLDQRVEQPVGRLQARPRGLEKTAR